MERGSWRGGRRGGARTVRARAAGCELVHGTGPCPRLACGAVSATALAHQGLPCARSARAARSGARRRGGFGGALRARLRAAAGRLARGVGRPRALFFAAAATSGRSRARGPRPPLRRRRRRSRPAGGCRRCSSRYFGVSAAASWLAAAPASSPSPASTSRRSPPGSRWLARRGPVLAAPRRARLRGLRVGARVARRRRTRGRSPPTARSTVRPLAQLADLAGPWGIAALLAVANALLAGVFAPALRPAPPLRAPALRLGAAARGGAFAYGEVALGRRLAPGPALRVARRAGRHRAPRQRRPRCRRLARGARALPRADREAVAAAKPALVVWPEGALDFSPFEPHAAHAPAPRRRGRSAPISCSARRAATRTARAATRCCCCAAAASRASTTSSSSCRSRSRRQRARPRPRRGRPGRRRSSSSRCGGLRIGTAICSEAMGPGYVRRVVAAGATVLVNPSNDYWFTSAAAARQQLAKTRLRAIETRRFVVRATSTGYSALDRPTRRPRRRVGLRRRRVARRQRARRRGHHPPPARGRRARPGALALCLLATLLRLARPRPGLGTGEARS